MGSNVIYEELRNSLLGNSLYIDEDFPADNSSIGYDGNYEWKRPHEICQLMDPPMQPEFIAQTNSFNLRQGKIGNCWVIVAFACVMKNDSIFKKVVPRDQDFSPEKYCGAFRFNIWRYGRWESVIVDDRLPTKDGKLVFAHSKIENEFWGALLEKAYAKSLKQKYTALHSGNVVDSLTDFTGGFVELYKMDNPNDSEINMYELLSSCLVNKGLAVASLNTDCAQEVLSNGLVTNHVYNITAIEQVNDDICLLRLRNPWGDQEWNGNWSDTSDSWDSLPEDIREDLNQQIEDGEFWMEMADFKLHFRVLAICNLLEKDVTDNICIHSEWSQEIFQKKWNFSESIDGEQYNINPLFLPSEPIELKRVDSDTTAVIELIRREEGQLKCAIGFKVFCEENQECDQPVPEPEEECPTRRNASLVNGILRTSESVVYQRSLLDKFTISHLSSYFVVPFIDRQYQDSDEFLIRVLCKRCQQ